MSSRLMQNDEALPTTSCRHSRATSIAVVAISFAICLARTIHPSERFSFWAEDGPIYTSQVRADGIWHSFFTTYDGYFQLLPRSIAAIASPLPLAWSPPIYSIAAMFITSVIATIAYRAGREAFRLPMPGAAVLAGTVLLLPAAGAETFATATNPEWYCLAGLAVYLAAWFEGWDTNPLLTGFLVLVASATTPLAITAFVFVVVRVFRLYVVDHHAGRGRLRTKAWRDILRGWKPIDIAVVVGFVGGLAWTLAGHLVAPSTPAPVHNGLTRIAAWYAVRVVDSGFLGVRLGPTMFHAFGERKSVAIGLVLLLVIVTLACVRARRPVSLLLIVTSVLAFVVPAFVRGFTIVSDLGYAPDSPPLGGRYLAAPAVCLVLALLLALRPSGQKGEHVTQKVNQTVLSAATLALAALLVYNVPVDLLRQPLSAWEQTVKQAQMKCSEDHGTGLVSVPNYPTGFGLQLTCKQAFG